MSEGGGRAGVRQGWCVEARRDGKGGWGAGAPHPSSSYEQLDEIIFTDCTSRRRWLAEELLLGDASPVVPVALPAVEPAVVPEVAVVVDAVPPELAELAELAADRPVTCTLWPTCFSRSLPPDRTHVEALFIPPDADGDEEAVPVVPAVDPVVPVVPAVVPLVAVVLLPLPDAVVELASLSIRAFVSV